MSSAVSNVSYPDQIEIKHGCVHGGTTMRNTNLPENGNMALHVCLDPKAVMKNRKALASAALPLENWSLPWQKHTANAVQAAKEDAKKGAYEAESSFLNTDAIYTTEPNLLVGVFTADCLGILFTDPTVPLVCAIHSGWKGTAQNIVYKTIQELDQKGLFHPKTIQVWFSPSIQKDSFEIGPEVKEQLLASGKEIGLDYSDLIEDDPGSDRSHADHQAMNVRVLESLHIPAENIHPSALDTKRDETCFSFRRDGSKTGEHFTYGWIKE